jgi:hypothetical protein
LSSGDGKKNSLLQDPGRQTIKPNPKYSPDIYDLDYVKVRKRSRKSEKRAQM